MIPLTKAQIIDYIKKNNDCLGDCESCLLRSSKLREIGVNPVPKFCSERFLVFVRRFLFIDEVLKINKGIIDSCIGRQNFLSKLTKKSAASRFLLNE